MSALRLAVPDLISPSYFPAIAAVRLGLFQRAGIDAGLELMFPVTRAARALRDGEIAFYAGAAHSLLDAFLNWSGVKLLAALSQNMYWFLVVRADLPIDLHNLQTAGGLRIGAAPGPDQGLRALLADAGIDAAAAGIEIAPVPGADGSNVSFGVVAAQALADGRIDAFWANGMAAEIAVRNAIGRVIVDARRGGWPPEAASYTFSALAVSERFLAEQPGVARAGGRAIEEAQALLRESPEVAFEAVHGLFPPPEAGLIVELVRRDCPFYDVRISQTTVDHLNSFTERMGLATRPAAYEEVVDIGAVGAVPLG